MSKIGDAEDIFSEAQSYIECVRLAACQLETSEESNAIAAVAMAAYQKIGEGIALLDECPEVREINDAEREQLRRQATPTAKGPKKRRTKAPKRHREEP
jgi:hypothetical protein